MERVLAIVLVSAIIVRMLVTKYVVLIVLATVVKRVLMAVGVALANVAAAKVTVRPIVLVPPNARNSIFFFIPFLTLFIAIYFYCIGVFIWQELCFVYLRL